MSEMKFNSLIPEFDVKDLAESLYFYVDIVGFKIEYDRKESKFAFLSYQGSQVMLEEYSGNWLTGPLEYPFGRGINFQIFVEKIDPILSALTKHGHPLMKAPWESWYRRSEDEVG